MVAMSTRSSAVGARMFRRLRPGALIVLAVSMAIWLSAICTAHEVRPSYLEVREERPGEFEALFKTPMRGDLRLSLSATFSGKADEAMPATMRTTGDAAVQTWRFRALEPLRGQTVTIAGLESTMTDALV